MREEENTTASQTDPLSWWALVVIFPALFTWFITLMRIIGNVALAEKASEAIIYLIIPVVAVILAYFGYKRTRTTLAQVVLVLSSMLFALTILLLILQVG